MILLKKQTLDKFISGWNKSRKHFTFSCQKIPVIERPAEVQIRYLTAKYREFLSIDKWVFLKDMVETHSHGTIYVSTDEDLFERGIIDIKVASANYNYQERLVIGVLRWIAEFFQVN